MELSYNEMLTIKDGLQLLVDLYTDTWVDRELLKIAQETKDKIDGIIRSYETMTFDAGKLKEVKECTI